MQLIAALAPRALIAFVLTKRCFVFEIDFFYYICMEYT